LIGGPLHQPDGVSSRRFVVLDDIGLAILVEVAHRCTTPVTVTLGLEG